MLSSVMKSTSKQTREKPSDFLFIDCCIINMTADLQTLRKQAVEELFQSDMGFVILSVLTG